MSYFVFRDGTLLDKAFVGSVMILIVFAFLRIWFPIPSNLIIGLFAFATGCYVIRLFEAFAKMVGMFAETYATAKQKTEELKSEGLPVTGESVTKAVQTEYVKRYKKKD